MSLGMVYQCFKNPLATFMTLSSTRKHYPTSTIVLISDVGYNYTKMAEYFNCIYIHCEQKALTLCGTGKHIENSKRLIERMKHALEMIHEEYVMLLEDDVIINGVINDDLRHDLNGYCPNAIQSRWIRHIQHLNSNLDTSKDYVYSGHGGAIYHRLHTIHALNNEVAVNDILVNWEKYELPTTVCIDFLFSILLTVSGYTIGSYKGHGDCNGFIHPELTVQHGFKTYYNQPLPQHLEHLIE